MRDGSSLSIFAAPVNSNMIVRVEGQLDLSNYGRLRDSILKFAADKPGAIIIDVSETTTRDSSAWALFTQVRWQLADLPAVPVALVCVKDRAAEVIQRMTVSRYVPMFPSIEAAVRAVTEENFRYRFRARTFLAEHGLGADRARAFVAARLPAWSMADCVDVASTVAALLVEDAIDKGADGCLIRMDSNGSALRLMVEYECVRPAGSAADGESPRIAKVRALCHRVGTSSVDTSQKVWALIEASGSVGDPQSL